MKRPIKTLFALAIILSACHEHNVSNASDIEEVPDIEEVSDIEELPDIKEAPDIENTSDSEYSPTPEDVSDLEDASERPLWVPDEDDPAYQEPGITRFIADFSYQHSLDYGEECRFELLDVVYIDDNYISHVFLNKSHTLNTNFDPNSNTVNMTLVNHNKTITISMHSNFNATLFPPAESLSGDVTVSRIACGIGRYIWLYKDGELIFEGGSPICRCEGENCPPMSFDFNERRLGCHYQLNENCLDVCISRRIVTQEVNQDIFHVDSTVARQRHNWCNPNTTRGDYYGNAFILRINQ